MRMTLCFELDVRMDKAPQVLESLVELCCVTARRPRFRIRYHD